MNQHTARRTLAALLAASAFTLTMTACTSDSPAPGLPPGQYTPDPNATAPATPTPSVDISKAAEEVENPTVNDGDAVKMYGADSVKAAQKTVADYAYTLTAPQILLGKVRGKDAVNTFGNLVTRDLYDELMASPKQQQLFLWELPAKDTPDFVRTLRLHYSDLTPNTEFKGQPGLVSTVTADVLMQQGNKSGVVRRTVTLTLLPQADTSEGAWRIGAYWHAADQNVSSQYPAQG